MKHLTKSKKNLIKNYIEHIIKKYELKNSFENKKHHFQFHDCFILDEKNKVRNYHEGMEFLAEQIIHSLKFVPSKKEYEKTIKQDAKLLNQDEC